MQKKFTSYEKTIACALLTIIAMLFNSVTSKTYAQDDTLFVENFGSGNTATSNPDVLPSGLTYQATGPLSAEGIYRVINSTQQKPEWQNSGDHTGNTNGDMLVVNGEAETFYSHTVNISTPNGFLPGVYHAGLFLMNIDTLGLCGSDALLTKMTFDVEYLSSDGTTWVPLDGSPFNAAPVVQTPASNPTWVALGGTATAFVLPNLGFRVTSIKLVLTDGTVGGCGNDFALDDIAFSYCSACGETPVTFLGITARQKGSGVSVDWSSSQEINSSHFDILKSADGSTNWEVVTSVNAAGNSSSVKKYSAFDPKPFSGINFYRVRQVDKDGNFAYTKTVSVNLNFAKVGISVLTNPFHNALRVDFTSATTQPVFARLIDITGKQVAMEKWTVANGSSTQYFSDVNGLQQGMYILNITSGNGEVLFNNKVIKQ